MRDRFNAFVERHDIAWELGMGFLAVLYVALGFLLDEYPDGIRTPLSALEVALTVAFVLEFGSRLLASRSRADYLRGHWVDAVALAPPVRAARVLRLLRLLRLVRTFAGVYRAVVHVQRLASHRGLAWLVVAWLAVMVICSIAMYAAEHGVNKAVDSPYDALWWGIVTLASVGYGDVYPITPEGRFAAMVLMLLGIGLFSGITATATSYLVASRPERPNPGLSGDLERLASLYTRGHLTQAEYEAAKTRVLNGDAK